LVNVQEKKVLEHQMGKQVVQSFFIAKNGKYASCFHIRGVTLRCYMADLAYPLQTVSLKYDNPLQQTNSCKLNFLNAVRGEASLDISVGSSVN
jgi:hypothetical protein